MAIERHISDGDLAETLRDPSALSNPHLQRCPSCRTDLERIRGSVDVLRSAANAAVSKPEDFWQQQQRAILTLIDSQRAQVLAAIPRLAFAAAAVILGIASLLLSTAPDPAPQAKNDADHELLIAVERALQSDGPAALEPATLLTHEISQDTSLNSTAPVHRKEIKHED